jgi:hypothetical protein
LTERAPFPLYNREATCQNTLTMIPANLSNVEELTIYSGSRWEHTITFRDKESGDPLDITLLAPFAAAISKQNKDEVVLEPLVTTVDALEGQISLLLTAEETSTLPLGKVRCGIRDSLNLPYAQGVLDVKFFSPDHI